jgi:hypothetical protein
MSLLGIKWIQIKFPHGFHLLTSYRTKWLIKNLNIVITILIKRLYYPVVPSFRKDVNDRPVFSVNRSDRSYCQMLRNAHDLSERSRIYKIPLNDLRSRSSPNQTTWWLLFVHLFNQQSSYMGIEWTIGAWIGITTFRPGGLRVSQIPFFGTIDSISPNPFLGQ